MPGKRIIFIPSILRGGGTGHLRRCTYLAQTLLNRGALASILLDYGDEGSWSPEEIQNLVPQALELGITSFEPESGDLVVFDHRETTESKLRLLAGRACSVLLDDDGSARSIASFVLDTIPGPRRCKANESSPCWLDLPPRIREPHPKGKVLVSFGGEDPGKLTLPSVEFLIHHAGIAPERITVTLPEMFQEGKLPQGVGLLHEKSNIKDRLAEFGMVVTSYGFTAWEAVAAGCGVITAAPSPYHRRLAREAGFIELSDLPKTDFETIVRASQSLSAILTENRDADLQTFLLDIEAPAPCCAACGRMYPPLISRLSQRSYYRCPDCGIIGLYRFESKPDEYGPAYFQEEYRQHYGRSYLEDFDAIKTMASSRLKLIGKRAPKGGRLLDVGCAFGPFLAAAAQAGYAAHGMDVSQEAVSYVQDELGIPAFVGSFPTNDFRRHWGFDFFDIVTMWYVIEHFVGLKEVLEVLSSLIPAGGVLALSTPNGRGISGRRNFRRFLEDSPEDHYTVWNPQIARRLLVRYGFRVYRIRVTGHHPERFGLPWGTKRWGAPLLGFISRLFGLGDTFEIYAVKESQDGRP